MNEIFDAMFGEGMPLFWAFALGTAFGVRVVRHVLVKRILQEENILDGGRSKDSRDPAPISRSS